MQNLEIRLSRPGVSLSAVALEIQETSLSNQRNGSVPVSPAVERDALELLRVLDFYAPLPQLPDLGIGNDGSLGLQFAMGEVYVYIDITSDNRIHYYAASGKNNKVEAVVERGAGYEIVAKALMPTLLSNRPLASYQINWFAMVAFGFLTYSLAKSAQAGATYFIDEQNEVQWRPALPTDFLDNH